MTLVMKSAPGGYAPALRFANDAPLLGDVYYSPDSQRLLIGLKLSTWDRLVPADERRQCAIANRARYEPSRKDDIRDPERTALVADLLDQPYGRSDIDLQPVAIPPHRLPLFREFFQALLAEARASDTVEIKPARMAYHPFLEKDVEIAAVTTPSAPIRSELEAIAAVVPDLQLDPDAKAVAA